MLNQKTTKKLTLFDQIGLKGGCELGISSLHEGSLENPQMITEKIC